MTTHRIAACLLLAVATAAQAQLTETALAPAADTTVFVGAGLEENADGAGPHLWTSITAGGFSRRALLRFDLSAIPANAVVHEVRLTLFHSRSLAFDTIALHRVLAPWGEGSSNAGTSGAGAPPTPGSATWIHRFFPDQVWSVPGGDFAPAASASTVVGGQSEFYTWGSTSQMVADVQAWLASPGANHGWMLIGGEDGERRGKRFESRENVTPSNRPRLVVRWAAAPPPLPDEGDIPLPPWALALLGAGLAAGLLRARR